MPARATPGSAADILALTRAVMTRARPETAGLWPRAAALLARQALEAALDAFWRTKGVPQLAACPTRQQLICLREYLPAEAGAVYEAWAVLTRACHHHAYEVAPTVGELGVAVGVVEGLAYSRISRPVALE